MKTLVSTTLRALILTGVLSAPAMAVDNPLVVDMHTPNSDGSAASGTLFQHGDNVLVNVTAQKGVPKDAALTLNDGSCAKPGGVAFALSPLADNQSMTTLNHTLSDIAGKAKSMVVHQTASQTSPAAACGDVKG